MIASLIIPSRLKYAIRWTLIFHIMLLNGFSLELVKNFTSSSLTRRKLNLKETIHEGLQFLHLESPVQANSIPHKDESDHGISFLDPDIVAAHSPSFLSKAIAFLDIGKQTAKEKEHLESLQEKHKQKNFHDPLVSETIQKLEKLQNVSSEVKNQSKQKKPSPKKKTKSPKDRNTHTSAPHVPKKESFAYAKVEGGLDTAATEVRANHPRISPRAGTDISPQQYGLLSACTNQATCIVPQLQLQKKYKIYFCKHPVRYGMKFYFLIREGLLLHPNVELLEFKDIQKADYIMYLPGSAPWHKTECNQTSYASRLIVLDEFDFHFMYLPTQTKQEYIAKYGAEKNPWYALYFKRSFVRRLDGKFQGFAHLHQYDLYPLVYPIAEHYIPHFLNLNREIDILCTLRGSKQMTTRLRVQTWVAEYGQERQIPNMISSQVDKKDRVGVSHEYFEKMYNARIIVTVNPSNWEGDFRLWESMVSGALVFVDPVMVPHQFPLVHGEHVIYFSNNNRTDLFVKLDYYRSHPDEARRIATNGYFHAMKYHRTVNLIDYFLRTAHMKEALDKQKNSADHHQDADLPEYTYTGQYLNFMAKAQEKMMKKCEQPGLYELFPGIPQNLKKVSRLKSCST
jgi:hypothetical protein